MVRHQYKGMNLNFKIVMKHKKIVAKYFPCLRKRYWKVFFIVTAAGYLKWELVVQFSCNVAHWNSTLQNSLQRKKAAADFSKLRALQEVGS